MESPGYNTKVVLAVCLEIFAVCLAGSLIGIPAGYMSEGFGLLVACVSVGLLLVGYLLASLGRREIQAAKLTNQEGLAMAGLYIPIIALIFGVILSFMIAVAFY